MSKTWQSIFIITLMLFLSACGGNDNNDNNNQNNDQQEQQKQDNNDNNEADNNQNDVNDNQNQNNEDDNQTDNGDDQANNQDEATSNVRAVGDTIEYNGLEITVNDAYVKTDVEYDEPSNDQYLVLDLTIENTGTEAQNVSTILQMSVQDEEGYTYDVDLFTETKGSLDGEVGPGRMMRGEVAFDVSKSNTYEFIFEDPFESGQAIWKINVSE